MSFINSLKKRRSIYALGKNIKDSDQAIETIKEAVKHSPTTFSSNCFR